MKESVGIGLLGMGVVGGGVARIISEKSHQIEYMVGAPVTVESVLVRDIGRARSFDVSADLLTTDAQQVLQNPKVDIVGELMGGEDPSEAAHPAGRQRFQNMSPEERQREFERRLENASPEEREGMERRHRSRGQPGGEGR